MADILWPLFDRPEAIIPKNLDALVWHAKRLPAYTGLVGLLGKVFGPIGFAGALLSGRFPPAFGWNIITNDLVWWIPFAGILAAFQAKAKAQRCRLFADPEKNLLHPRPSLGKGLLHGADDLDFFPHEFPGAGFSGHGQNFHFLRPAAVQKNPPFGRAV
ncbi:MAG: hypothetical protein EBS01_15230 [Verrucomicrobia bacterium]|nr:hypothetical protein [Verrucomicrobiota bacterium]